MKEYDTRNFIANKQSINGSQVITEDTFSNSTKTSQKVFKKANHNIVEEEHKVA